MLTQRDLDATGCGTADCGHDHSVLMLIATCHPRAGVMVEYHKSVGGLFFSCKSCRQRIVEIEVAAIPGGRA